MIGMIAWIIVGALVAMVVIAFLVDRRNRQTFNNDPGYRPEERPTIENHPAQGSGGGGGDMGG